MISEIKIPKLGMTQADITVIQLLKEPGSQVEAGEPVALIETSKVTHELEAPCAGLVFFLKKVKDKLAIGEVLGVICDSRESFDSYAPAAGAPAEEGADAARPAEDDGDWGVNITFLDRDQDGPAPDRAPAPAPAPKAAPAMPSLEGRRVHARIPFVGMRRTIADNLTASLQNGAQLTIVTEADMTELGRLRQTLKRDYPGTKITFVHLLLKILAVALREHPILNSQIAGDEIICWEECHLGVAVAVDEGLVVPVVKNVDQKGLAAVCREVESLSRQARKGELSPDKYQGGTFTLTSGGRVETDIITPIINPPQNAILAIGKIGPRPAVHQGQLAVREMTHLCLTHDHRAIDGVPASMFLGRVKQLIETPDLLQKVLR